MNQHINEAFKKFDECMNLMEKGIKDLFLTKKAKKGTKIRIKKGSKVYLGKNTYATLLEDVVAQTDYKIKN